MTPVEPQAATSPQTEPTTQQTAQETQRQHTEPAERMVAADAPQSDQSRDRQQQPAQSEPAGGSPTDQQEAQEQGVVLPPPIRTFLPRDAAETADGLPIIRDSETPQYFGSDWGTDWTIRLVDYSELSVGAGRDAIPALSSPLYWTIEEAIAEYADAAPLVHIEINGDVRGFPLDILLYHEIVNDVIGGLPVAITYCPLCNTAIAFKSQIGADVYKFGVSGLLRNSDLVMYDHNTESLWQQSTGRAIVGAMVGARLEYIPAPVVSMGQLRTAFPDALVLSRDTKWNRPYGQNPYRGYDDPEEGGPYPFFFDRETIDERLPPAERVVSIESVSGATIAYAWSALRQNRVIQDEFDSITLVIFWTPGTVSVLDNGFVGASREIGTTAVFESVVDDRSLTFAPNELDPSQQTFIDNETQSVWNIFGHAIDGELAGSQLTRVIHTDHFWFAWQAFHPDTEVVAQVTALGDD